ncbi:hypothetical protein PUN28_003595 [Cardiocondyla obscurior]|uniref:Uncharacterized protein n=1 Tax=Cardiocondyla obscurior TaxID=286306 RepID=A0AAW2GL46_9HYME
MRTTARVNRSLLVRAQSADAAEDAAGASSFFFIQCFGLLWFGGQTLAMDVKIYGRSLKFGTCLIRVYVLLKQSSIEKLRTYVK